jgi:hypothetical protein
MEWFVIFVISIVVIALACSPQEMAPWEIGEDK